MVKEMLKFGLLLVTMVFLNFQEIAGGGWPCATHLKVTLLSVVVVTG